MGTSRNNVGKKNIEQQAHTKPTDISIHQTNLFKPNPDTAVRGIDVARAKL